MVVLEVVVLDVAGFAGAELDVVVLVVGVVLVGLVDEVGVVDVVGAELVGFAGEELLLGAVLPGSCVGVPGCWLGGAGVTGGGAGGATSPAGLPAAASTAPGPGGAPIGTWLSGSFETPLR